MHNLFFITILFVLGAFLVAGLMCKKDDEHYAMPHAHAAGNQPRMPLGMDTADLSDEAVRAIAAGMADPRY